MTVEIVRFVFRDFNGFRLESNTFVDVKRMCRATPCPCNSILKSLSARE